MMYTNWFESIFRYLKIPAFLFLLMVGVFSCGVFDSRVDFNQGKALQSEYIDTIPFDYVRGKIIVPVTIEKDTFDFIFDSGAPTIVSEQIMKRFSLPLLGADTISDTHKNKENRQIALIKRLKLGDISFGDTPAIISSFNNLPWACFKINGIIGSNLLRNSVVKIDLNNRKLLISNSIRPQMKAGEMKNISMKLDHQSSPYVHITFKENLQRRFLFDTGSDDFINLNKSEFNEIKDQMAIKNLRSGYGSGTMGLFGPGEKKDTYKLKLDSLGFCEYRFTNPLLKVTAAGSKIGSQILEYGPVILDYVNRKLYFYSKADPVEYKKLTPTEFGFSPVLENDQLKFGLIWENSVADSIGLEPGYRILRINEYDFTSSLEASFCDIFIKNSLVAVDTLNIVFENLNGKRNKIQLIRKD